MQFHHHAGVAPRTVALGIAHAIDNELVGTAGSRYDGAARTHAEGIDAATVHLRDKRIFGGRQVLAPTLLAMVLNLVDEFRRMLQTDTHSDVLCLDLDALRIEITIDIAGAVSSRQDDRTHECLIATTNALHLVIFEQNSIHLRLEMHFATTSDDGLAHRLDDARQLVGAEMRMGVCQDACAGSVLTEHVQDLLHIAALLAPRVELAVGESPRTALAEGIVRFGIDGLRTADLRDVLPTLMHALAALHHDGSDAQFDESQCREQSARTGTHHHRLRLVLHIRIVRPHKLVILRQLVHIRPHLQVHVDGALTGVDAPFQHPHRRHMLRRQSLLLKQEPLDGLFTRRHLGQNSNLILFYHSFSDFVCKGTKKIPIFAQINKNNMENYIVSARKYRPMTFDTVVGQGALTVTLKNAIQSGRLAHAYLFCGPRGVGKTTCARIFAKTINCLNPQANGEACGECESCKAFNEGRSYNIHELDAASNNSVEDIRVLIEQVRIPPQIGKYKVFIIDEVHMLSQAAFNAFLKTLEEPPQHAIFILATTEKHKILPTIMSRCQIYDFKRMAVNDIVGHLKHVAEQEGIKVEEAALNIIAQKADGGMRDALSIFDQVASFCSGNITYQQTIENLNVLDYDYYFRLTDYFLEGKITECMLTLNEILSKGFEGQYFITGLSSHFRNLLVSQDAQTAELIEASDEVRNRYKEQAQKCKPKFLFRAMKLANDCDLNYKQSQNKRLLVEITLIEMAQLSSDDGEASGLCPTKILKPIFQALRPKTEVFQNVQPASPAKTESPARTAAPSVITPQSSPITPRRPGAFSIRRQQNSQSQQSTTVQETVVVPTFENQPVNPTDLTVAWREFAKNLPQEDRALSFQLDNMEPQLQEDGQTILVIVDNPSLQGELHKIQPRIEGYLHQRLQNNALKLTTRLREATDKRRALSRMEIFNEMLEQSEALRKLKEEFELELA